MTHESPHDKAADAVHEGRPVEAQYVRGGRGGVRILTLLVISLAAVAILLLGMWFVSQGGFAKTNANDGDQAVDAAAFQADRTDIPAADAPTTSTGQPTTPPTGEAPNVNAPVVSAQPSAPAQ
ncbi:hypothetical protein GGQ87_001174 [Brevundimonas alba]|uniref:Uncharacterized protein n=1 Tax=Brevundimonas alba TaxID=74314 RepID=A0A7X5YJ52_9CAUL|nr:hypothetical protein [Brevundimonas alba]NJC40916.1 hypothetical protein [Brevundimonas alba]